MREPGFHFANPSELLLEEDPKPRGVEPREAGKQLGVLLKRLNEIVFGKRGIAADTALRLGRSQRTPPQLWMRLQADWGLHQAMQRARRKASLPRLAVPVLYPILRFLVDLAVSGGFDSAEIVEGCRFVGNESHPLRQLTPAENGVSPLII